MSERTKRGLLSGRAALHRRRCKAGAADDEAGRGSVRLAELPRGRLTEREIEVFGLLRGPVSENEIAVLRSPELEVLRSPAKRLKVLDLLRWSVPRVPRLWDDRRPLPLLAGLEWLRPLDDLTPTADRTAVDLARHLWCLVPVPAFLFEPFTHAERLYPFRAWERSRLLSMVGRGLPLEEVQRAGLFPETFTHGMYRSFLASSADTPVLVAFRQAQVNAFGGPQWLGAVLADTVHFGRMGRAYPSDLERIEWLCRHAIERSEVPRVVRYLSHAYLGPLRDRAPDSVLADTDVWYARRAAADA